MPVLTARSEIIHSSLNIRTMAQLQEIFDRIKEQKKEQRLLRESYKNTLANSASYQNTLEELDRLKEKKRNKEESVQAEMKSDFEKLDRLKLDIASDNEMMSDLAMNQLMSGKTVEITDEYGNRYEPRFSVKFKKA